MAAKFDNNKLALTLSGRAKKKTWTKAEDAQLAQLVDVHGTTNWTLIAEHLPKRTGKQCRERYNNHLQPDVNKGEWTEEEDATLERLHEELGNQWSKMTRELPGRTDNAIKNRWHSTHRCFNEASVVPISPAGVSVHAGSVALAPAAIPSVSSFTFSSVALVSTHSFYHEYHDHEVVSAASSPATSPSKINMLAHQQQQQHHVFPSSSKSTFLSAAVSVDQDDCSEGATSEDSRTTAASSLSEELEMFPGNMEGFELVVQGHAISTSNFRLFMDLDSLDCSPATEVDDAFFPDDDVDYASQSNELGGDLEELFACWEASNDAPEVPKLGSSLHKLGGGMSRSFRDSWGSLSPCARSPNKSRISTPVAAKKCRWQ